MPVTCNGIGIPFRRPAFSSSVPVNLDFISTWDTTKAGSASNTVVLPLLSGGVYSGTIDWGDGNSDALSYANRTHVYASSGIYTITISGTDIRGFQFNNGGDKLKITDISNWGNLTITTNAAFSGCANFNSTATDAPTISTTDLRYTFSGCTTFDGNINNWDVSSVTNMGGMFFNATSFNQPLNDWDTSSLIIVRDSFYGMFRGATSFNQDIGNFDVSGVSDFERMFQFASDFNNGGSDSIKNWDMSSATKLGGSGGGMFGGASSFNQPIGNWDVSNVQNFESMFSGATSFNQDIGGWDMSSATNINQMFYGAAAFNNGGSNSINNWDVSNIVNFGTGFYGLFRFSAFNQPINNWEMSQALRVPAMFSSTPFNQPLNSWDTSNMIDMQRLFQSNNAFDQDLSTFSIANVSNFTFFLDSANGLSTSNYDATLIAWESELQAAYPSGVGYTPTISIPFGGSKYTLGGAAEAARTSLISTFGWTITDGGGV